MKCRKCGREAQSQPIDEQKTRVTCGPCNLVEVIDVQGRRLLEEVPDRRQQTPPPALLS